MQFLGRLMPKKRSAADDPASLGNILIQLGLITREQLDLALQKQAQAAPLGEILVGMGSITQSQLEWALVQQSLARGEKQAAERVLAYSATSLREVTKSFTELGQLAHAAAKAHGK